MTLVPWELAYIAFAAIATALLHSVGGFAGALMLAIAIAPVVGIKVTVPVVATAMIVSNSSRVWLFRKAIDWRVFRLVFLVALPFILLGIVVYVKLPEAIVAIFLGAFLLGAGLAGEALIATVAALGFCLNAIKTVAFGLSPLLTGELAAMGLLIGLCTIPGHQAGRWIVRNTPLRVHTYILEAFMCLGGLHFLWRGIVGPTA